MKSSRAIRSTAQLVAIVSAAAVFSSALSGCGGRSIDSHRYESTTWPP